MSPRATAPGTSDARRCGELEALDNDDGYRFRIRAHEPSGDGKTWVWSATYRFKKHEWDKIADRGQRVCMRARHTAWPSGRPGDHLDVASKIYRAAKVPVCSASYVLFCEGKIPFDRRYKKEE